MEGRVWIVHDCYHRGVWGGKGKHTCLGGGRRGLHIYDEEPVAAVRGRGGQGGTG